MQWFVHSNYQNPQRPRKTLQYRDFKSIDKQKWREDLESFMSTLVSPNAESITDQFNDALRALINEHSAREDPLCEITP